MVDGVIPTEASASIGKPNSLGEVANGSRRRAEPGEDDEREQLSSEDESSSQRGS
jgi:hypothetical protein